MEIVLVVVQDFFLENVLIRVDLATCLQAAAAVEWPQGAAAAVEWPQGAAAAVEWPQGAAAAVEWPQGAAAAAVERPQWPHV